MIGKTISHYKILEKLGGGGMGVVYKAEDTKLKRIVALKFLPSDLLRNEEAKKRLTLEAQAASALDHNNICTIHEINETEDGQLYIAMANYDGETLETKIEQKQLSFENTIDIIIQVAQGLSKAHETGIVHRDVKPSNIMITNDGVVKILDFGLAKLSNHPKLTKKGSTLGTVAYMSPEQIQGEEVDRRADIWAIGVILYEMITGQLPFKGEYDQAIIYSILNESPESISNLRTELPPRIEQILTKCISKKKEARYQNVNEMMADLRLLKQQMEFPIISPKPTVETTSRSSKSSLVIIVASIVIVVLSSLLFWVFVKKESGITTSIPHQITLKQITFAEELEEYPSFSPDGRQIVFCREKDNFKHLYIKNLENGEETQITRGEYDDIQPTFSPDGKTILFVRSNLPNGKLEPGDVYSAYYDGDIWKYALETKKENKIIEDAYNPSFSPDGQHIAFDASWAGPRRIWIADKFGRNPFQLSFNPSEAVLHISPNWSPDGSKTAFQVIEKTKFDILVASVESKEVINITDDLYTNINPVWSSTGKFIYFSSYRSGGRNIWRVPVSENGKPLSNPQQVTTGAGEDIQLSISPDGGQLAFSILRINADLWKLPVSPLIGHPTGDPQQVIATTREDSRGAWSPDGTKIAFNSDRGGEMNIWIHSIEDGVTQQITRGSGGDYQPNWSPDGKKLTFFSARSGNADIWVVGIETKQLAQLTKNDALDMNPFFSPDGKMIAYQSDQDGRKEVWVMNEDGSNQQRLTNGGTGGHFLRWSRDGKSIIYKGGLDGKWQLLKVSVRGEDPEPFAEIKGGSHISFSPDYRKIMDVTGHNTLWVTPINLGEPQKVFPIDEIDFRIDYPVWSPDGKWILFDRVKPQGGDIWIMENFE